MVYFSLALVSILTGFFGAAQSPSGSSESSLPPAATKHIQFASDIQPILAKNCFRCHGEKVQMGGLRLDQRLAVLAGGSSGPAIVPGDSAASRLIQLASGTQKLVMPFDGDRLTRDEVSMLRAWVDQGANWPEETSTDARLDTGRNKSGHWAYVAPERPVVPYVRNRAWVRNRIDSFILSTLESQGVAPSPEVERATLIRRLSLDLTGLPPSIQEVEGFLADNRPDAYERQVERLLASPHYGEKWARHWLDVARYADSDGYTDRLRPHAWRYRHWLIEALNRNMPFDQFTIEQIAGDLLPAASLEQRVATGFHRNTMTNREDGVDIEEFRAEQNIDRVSTVGTVWLGLTVGCARCHNHKYDPITQKDFYQLYAFFNNSNELDIEAPLPSEIGSYLRGRAEYDKKRQALLAEYNVVDLQLEWEKKILEAAHNPEAEVAWTLSWRRVGLQFDGGQEILRLDPSQRTPKRKDRLTDYFVSAYESVAGKERYEQLKFKELGEKLKKLSEEYPGLSEAQTIAESPTKNSTHIFRRGDYRQPGEQVQPKTPAFLHPLSPEANPDRLALARWLVSGENPLTARVTVNRIWQEYFGKGLVESSENFGVRGDPPSHPALLDWLATEFVANGWDVKRMHRLIVTSATYRQASQIRKDLQDSDPTNKLLARASRLRLQAELVRDVTLSVSGLLNPAVGGKSVRPPLPAGASELEVVYWKESEGSDRYRRGLYTLSKRAVPYPQFKTFDAPDMQQSCTRRTRSTSPLQALNLLNDPVFFEAAQALAARVLREKKGNVSDRVEYAFRLCLSRPPTSAEKERLTEYYDEQSRILERDPAFIERLFPVKSMEGVNAREAAVWVVLGSVLLNLDEFITRE